ncbi:chemotaxis protein CheW [Halodesulfurarchaeum sp. HSR-GB]|uniref:chemotaxis protein CheW n=1 Tax=Halodesulfurarchaeum sp. HSR-GB TaxID=3074077 RepID=UPI002861FD6A|nr:chemotaxis protein CheW [Halodesulfurarchaeum sp. HSR-GB]MDR5656864.1 chemotaxis protein CheW [Halodesulfurarchaeum sp. HSR-GB]
MSNEDTSVLEFSLGDDRYCIDITQVEEIVDADEEITAVPNAAPEVEGVVDLRGETTTIVDPTVALDLDATTSGQRIVVLADEDGTGLLIDDVHQVLSVTSAGVDESTSSATTRGVIRVDDRFVVWVEPSALLG